MYRKIILSAIIIAGLAILSSCGSSKNCRPKRGMLSNNNYQEIHKSNSDLVLSKKVSE